MYSLTLEKVFDAMFKSDFQEGLSLTSNQTCCVPLPDDYPEAMHALCIVLHHQSQKLSYDIDAGFLHIVASLTDKYACSNAVSPWGRGILLDLVNDPNREASEDAHLLYPAIVFDAYIHFAGITRRLVYFSGSSQLDKSIHRRAWDLSEDDQSLLPNGLLSE